MMKPTIHMNGSSAAHLAVSYATAADAIQAAMEQLARSAPNARDYYPQDTLAFARARAEHDARMDRMREVRAELVALHEHCRGGITR